MNNVWADEILAGIEIQAPGRLQNGRRRQSRIVQNGDVAYVELTRGLWALIDARDIALVAGRAFHAQPSDGGMFYANCNQYMPGKPHIIGMHRLILGEGVLQGDHINLNGLDNRRLNLRPASASENTCNRRRQKNNKSGFKGVEYYPNSGKYYARIAVNRRTFYLGAFNTAEAAHDAYCKAARDLHRDFARVA